MSEPKNDAATGAVLSTAGLGVKLARDLMSLGDGVTPAQRIQFMGGTYPNDEIDQGGMCEIALASFFDERIRQYMVTANAEVKGAARRPG